MSSPEGARLPPRPGRPPSLAGACGPERCKRSRQGARPGGAAASPSASARGRTRKGGRNLSTCARRRYDARPFGGTRRRRPEGPAGPSARRTRKFVEGRSLRMREIGSGAAPGATVVATVKWYDPVTGYGLLTPADGARDVFCHASVVGRAGWDTLPEGASVTCDVGQGRQGPQVLQIHAVDPPAASLSGTAGSGGWLDQGRGTASGDRAPSPGRRLVASVKWFVPARGFWRPTTLARCVLSYLGRRGGRLRHAATRRESHLRGRGRPKGPGCVVHRCRGHIGCRVQISRRVAPDAWRHAVSTI